MPLRLPLPLGLKLKHRRRRPRSSGRKALSNDYQGSPYASNYDQAADTNLGAALGLNDISVGSGQGLNTNTGILGMNTGTLTQASGLGFGPGFAATGIQADLGLNDITSSPSNLQDVNWGAVFEAPTQALNWDPVFEGAAPAYDPMDSPFSTPTSTDDASTLGSDPSLSGEAASPDVNWGSVFEGAPSNQNVNWDALFEGAAPNDVNWDAVFEGAPSNQNVNWDAVWEGAAPAPAPAPTPAPISLDTVTVNPDTVVTPEGITATEYNNAIDTFAMLDAAAAAQNARDAAAFDAADQANQGKGAPALEGQPFDTTMESGAPGTRTTTDDATTPGGDPALSGQPGRSRRPRRAADHTTGASAAELG